MDDDRWITREELAQRLRLPVKTLAQWAHLGKGPRYAIFGRHARYCMSDVRSWEGEQLIAQ